METSVEHITRGKVEDFLFEEAALLDQWRLREWLELFSEDCGYFVPSNDDPHGDHDSSLFLIADNRRRLESRVSQLIEGRFAHAEYPKSRTRRLISNVRILEASPNLLRAASNFIVYRMRLEVTDVYVGRYEHTLDCAEEGFRIRERRAVLDHESLRPHGKVSFLL